MKKFNFKNVDKNYSKTLAEKEDELLVGKKLKTLIAEYYQTKDATKLNTIIMSLQKLILSCIKQSVLPERVDEDDLIQEGNLAIMEAIQKQSYDPQTTEPSTYFTKVVNSRIVNFLGANYSDLTMSLDAVKRDIAINKVKKAETRQLDPKQVKEVTALKTKYKLTKKELANYTPNNFVSIYSELNNNDDRSDDTKCVGDIIEDNKIYNTNTLCKDTSLYTELKKYLKQKEYNILLERYIDNRSIDEISKNHKLEKQQVYSMLSGIVCKLRNNDSFQKFCKTLIQ